MTRNLELVEFQAGHLALMRFTRPEMSAIPYVQDLDAYGHRLAASGPAYSLFVPDGEIIAAAGIGIMWPGVGEGWFMASEAADRYFFSVHAVIRRVMVRLVEDLRLHRLQIAVPADSERAVAWAYRLGFGYEGHMLKYGPDGSTYYQFARVA
jgi:hypothetical protein